MNIIAYFLSLVSLVAIDSVWLFTMAGQYKKWLGSLMSSSFNFLPVFVFYPLYALALTILVLVPAIKNGYTLAYVFCLGAIMGLAAYGAYDLTNQATLKDWPWILTLVDMAWGAFLTGIVSVISVFIFRLFQ